jgi:hypothetical protein
MAHKAGRAMKRAAGFALKLGRAAGRMAKTGLLAVAGAATAAILGITKMADGMDNLAKKTRAINFPIEEFQEFQFAFQQAGVDSQIFEKSLGKFTKNLGEAQGGYGAMVTALKKTNPQLLKQLKTVDSTSEAFEIYIEEIRKAPTAAKKAALASAAFGRAGLEMINGANLSSEALAELRGQMRENGVVTAEQAAKAEEFNDMWNRVKLTIMGTLRDAIAPMLPQITKFLDKMRKWVVENKKLIGQKIQDVAKRIWENLKKLFRSIKDNMPAIKEFFELLKDVGGAMMDGAKWAIENRDAVLALGIAFAGFKVAGVVAGLGAIGLAAAPVLVALTAIVVALKTISDAREQRKKTDEKVGGFVGGLTPEKVKGMSIEQRDLTSKFLREEIARRDPSTMNKTRAIALALKGGAEENQRIFDESKRKLDALNVATRKERAFGRPQADTSDAELQGLAGQARGGGGAFPFSVQPPASQVVNTESTNTERSEVTIKDETGRAEVTKGGKNGGFKLVQTGGMI